MGTLLGSDPIQVDAFTVSVVASGGYFFARIRRTDGEVIIRGGQSHAAIGTKPCFTALAAFEEARRIIRHIPAQV
jgi:hypothetical protein